MRPRRYACGTPLIRRIIENRDGNPGLRVARMPHRRKLAPADTVKPSFLTSSGPSCRATATTQRGCKVETAKRRNASRLSRDFLDWLRLVLAKESHRAGRDRPSRVGARLKTKGWGLNHEKP